MDICELWGLLSDLTSFFPPIFPWPSHLQVKSNEEGMRMIEDLGHYFRDVHLWWMGPFYPVLRLVHPTFVAPLLQAPGISPRIPSPVSPLLLLPALPISGQTRLNKEMSNVDRDLPITK